MKRNSLLLLVFLLFSFYGCKDTKEARESETNHVANTSKNQIDSLSFVITKFYTYTCKDGHLRIFGDMCLANRKYEGGHTLFYCDGNDLDELQYINLTYQRYEDDPDYFENLGGIPDLPHSLVSHDRKNLYIVTRVHANSNGWVTEYQLFKIDCETLESKFICECAAIATTNKGFTIAVARITNEETATCTADEIWVMHDEDLDWKGNVIKVSNKEYSYEIMKKKYLQGEDTLIKGFSGMAQSKE